MISSFGSSSSGADWTSSTNATTWANAMDSASAINITNWYSTSATGSASTINMTSWSSTSANGWVSLTNSSPLTNAEAKIRSFAKLPSGWHYGSGQPATLAMIAIALKWLRDLALLGFHESEAFPGEAGEIMITAYLGDHCIELTFELDGTVTIAHQHKGEDLFYEPEISPSRASSEVQKIVAKVEQEKWHMFAWSTLNTIITAKANSVTSPSRSQAMEQARLYLTNPAGFLPVEASVPTLSDSIRGRAGTLQYSGALNSPKLVSHAA
jgi:hypothetical protein